MAPSWLSRHKNLTAKVNCDPRGGVCICSSLPEELPRLFSEKDQRRDVLASFEEWKTCVRVRSKDDGSKERWTPCFTSRTRVLPTLDWTLATVRQNAKRSLRKKFPPASSTMALIQAFVSVHSSTLRNLCSPPLVAG